MFRFFVSFMILLLLAASADAQGPIRRLFGRGGCSGASGAGVDAGGCSGSVGGQASFRVVSLPSQSLPVASPVQETSKQELAVKKADCKGCPCGCSETGICDCLNRREQVSAPVNEHPWWVFPPPPVLVVQK